MSLRGQSLPQPSREDVSRCYSVVRPRWGHASWRRRACVPKRAIGGDEQQRELRLSRALTTQKQPSRASQDSSRAPPGSAAATACRCGSPRADISRAFSCREWSLRQSLCERTERSPAVVSSAREPHHKVGGRVCAGTEENIPLPFLLEKISGCPPCASSRAQPLRFFFARRGSDGARRPARASSLSADTAAGPEGGGASGIGLFALARFCCWSPAPGG